MTTGTELGPAAATPEKRIADHQIFLASTVNQLNALTRHLTNHGYSLRLADGELTNSAHRIKVNWSYSGGEFLVRITAPSHDHPLITLRITQALVARKPGEVNVLIAILRRIGEGEPFTVYRAPGRVDCGIGVDGLLFGDTGE